MRTSRCAKQGKRAVTTASKHTSPRTAWPPHPRVGSPRASVPRPTRRRSRVSAGREHCGSPSKGACKRAASHKESERVSMSAGASRAWSRAGVHVWACKVPHTSWLMVSRGKRSRVSCASNARNAAGLGKRQHARVVGRRQRDGQRHVRSKRAEARQLRRVVSRHKETHVAAVIDGLSV